MSDHPNQPLGGPVLDWKPPPAPAREVIQGRFCRLEPLEVEKHARQLFEANALDTTGATWKRPQPRHRLVCRHRQRMARASCSLRAVAQPSEFR